MKEKSGLIRESYLVIIIIIAAFLPIILYSQTPFFGDDFTWIKYAKENQNTSLYYFFTNNGPFNYFRPIAVVTMNLLYTVFQDNVLGYRIICGVLYSASALLLFKILLKSGFEKSTSFLTVILFLFISSHSEVIFMICCINILIADLFILGGLYAYLNTGMRANKFISLLLFTLAMFTRESSVYFIFLLILLHFYIKKERQFSEVVLFVVPLGIYLISRLLLYYFDQRTYSYSRYYVDLSMVKIVYKFFHYLLISIFPVKSFFLLTGFEFYNKLRSSFTGTYNSVFYMILAVIFVINIIISFIIFKRLKSKIVFPFLMFLSCIILYLPSENVAERFNFIACFGTSLLVVLFFKSFNNKVLSTTFITTFILIHLTSLLVRGYIYYEFSNKFLYSIKNLNESVINGNILIENAPAPYKGQLFLSKENFNDAFKYLYPEKRLNFMLGNHLSDEDTSLKASQTFILDNSQFIFIPK